MKYTYLFVIVFNLLAAVLMGGIIGLDVAHQTVATECQRLGEFYVGKTTYRCSVIGEKQ